MAFNRCAGFRSAIAWAGPKGGAAKLKAYLAAVQRVSAGEAPGAARWSQKGAARSAEPRHGCLAAEASEGALVALSCSHWLPFSGILSSSTLAKGHT